MDIKAFIHEFIMFWLKLAYACMFSIYLVGLMLITSYWYPFEHIIYRYDFLFLAAIAFQVLLLATKLETSREAIVIIVFHFVATIMELFKTSNAIGSWVYPEPFVIGYGNVPFFAGFMYSAVGSFIARIWRIFEFEYSYYPSKPLTIVVVILIYLNFFTHHYIWDFRWVLLATVILMFYKTDIYFKVLNVHRKMPLLIGWFLTAFFIWIAENLSTFAGVWLYPNQMNGWQMVSLGKLSSWYLLMLLSFVLVSLVNEIHIRKSLNK